MPGLSPRQSYRVTANTVVYWVLVGTVAFFVKPFIPPLVNQRLASSKAGYVRQASGQLIEWQEMSPAVFERSRETGKPVFVAIGTEWSDISSDLDKRVFSSGDVSERLNRDFIPVRVDAQMYRAWSSCFLQLTRAEQGWETHSQLLFLSGGGRILKVVDVSSAVGRLDDIRFIAILDEVRYPKPSTESDSAEVQQRRENQSLDEGFEQAVADPDSYRDGLLAALVPDRPGLGSGPNQLLPSRDFAFLIGAGQQQAVQAQVDSLMRTPAFSWLDGVFFRSARDDQWRRVSLSVSAARNADMLEVLGALTKGKPGSPDRRIADQIFESLLDRFVSDGKFYAASYTDIGPDQRSARYSLSYSRARRVFGQDAGHAADLFGLDPGRNPLMLPFAGTWPIPSSKSGPFLALVDRMRAAEQSTPATMAGESNLDVGSRVASALLRYAASTGQQDQLDRALAASDRLQAALVNDSDVVHSFNSVPGTTYLGDFTNFAELELTRFRLFGDVASLESGRKVLDSAWNRYTSNVPGVVFNAKFSAYGDVAENWTLPKLVDDDLPSTCAQMAYLLRAYASLEPNTAVRSTMRERADQIVRAMAPAAAKISRQLGTFYLAALWAQADTAVFTVGPDSVRTARLWDPLATLAWTYPAVASVRPDIQARGPGIYVETNGSVVGPLTVGQVQSRLAQRQSSVDAP